MQDLELILNGLDAIGTTQSYICNPDQCSNILNDTSNTISLLHVNIRSVNRNIDELAVFLHAINIQPEVITLTECWLSKASHIPQMDGYVSYHTVNNINQNDGVIVYIKCTVAHTVTEPLILDTNCLICKIEYIDLVIIAMYRPPCNSNIENFLNGLENTLATLTRHSNVVLIGDLNINLNPEKLNNQANEYLNLTAQHGLFPTHNLPTRGKNCLDHIFLKSYLKSITLVFDTYITDHAPILLNINTKQKIPKPKTVMVKVDYPSVYTAISNTDFSTIMHILDADMAAQMLVSLLGSIIQQHTITRPIPSKIRILKPWITNGLLRCIRNRDAMCRKLKTDPNNYTFKLTFVRYRNFCNKLLKRLKHAYEKTELQKAKNNPKETWKVIKNIIQSNSTDNTPSKLLNIGPDKNASVNMINNYFANIGIDLAQKILSNRQNLTNTEGDVSVRDSLVLMPTDECEVEQIIRTLRCDAAAGWDEIPTKLLQKCSNCLVPAITHICNIAMSSGVFPKVFKRAIVHPIFKSGDRDDVNNYRPISVLPALSKVLEKLLNIRLISFLNRNDILAPNQFGFREGKSTEDCVSSLVDKIVNFLDKKQKCLCIFLDLTKAFDTVSVSQLLVKMERMGIRGCALEIFEDYLSDRAQVVKIGKFISENASLKFGVPQGSILGPSLFLLYINSLCLLSLPNCNIFTYADDTALLIHGKSWTDVFNTAEHTLMQVTQWLTSNLLTLNPNKTIYMTFSLTSSSQPSTEHFILKAHTCDPMTYVAPSSCSCPIITRSTQVKYLGVLIDPLISWKSHITVLTARVRKTMYIFKKLRYSLDFNTLKMVYCALCQSILTYCVTVWGGAAKTLLLPLERAQRAVLKTMTFKPFRYPTIQLLNDCKTLSVRQLFILGTVLRMHSSLEYDESMATKRRTHKVCQTQRYNCSLASRNYKVIGCHLYNLINKSCNIYTLITFKCKRTVSNWLLNKTYDETENLLKISIL